MNWTAASIALSSVSIVVSAGVLYYCLLIRPLRQLRQLSQQHSPDNARTASLARVAPDMIRQMEDTLLTQVGLDVDLCERALNDLHFMHGQLNFEFQHSCPVCETTMPELEKVIHRLRSVKITIQDGGDV